MGDLSELKGFIDDLRSLAVLRHPSLVLMMGFSLEGNDKGYIVFEFIKGKSLEDYKGILPAGFPKELGLILGYLKMKGVLDLHLKKTNILVSL